MKLVDRLDPRLKTIARMVRPGIRLADVGCDHGYLIAALAGDGDISGGIACDISRGPLDNARAEIARRGLEGRVECRLGNGLEPVGCGEVDDVVIAGMGGEMISSIMEGCGWQGLEGKRFILQPMSRAPFLRRWLSNNGFTIERERACFSGGHYYTVMAASYTGVSHPVGEYDLYGYIGGLGCDGSREAREFLLRTLSELEKQRKGAGFSDPGRERGLTGVIDKLRSVTEEGI